MVDLSAVNELPTSETSRFSVEKDVLNELLLIFSVIGANITKLDHDPKKNKKDTQKIVPISDCLNWLQDLQRALRRDDDTYRPISLQLHSWKVVENKLIPLAISCKYDTSITLTIAKILVILTKPMNDQSKRAARLVLDPSKTERKVVEEQRKLRENSIAQSTMLMHYKKLFTQYSNMEGDGLLSIFVSLLSDPLSRTGSARTDSDHLTIELVLHLFRNLLNAEPVIKVSSDTSEQARNVHNKLVTLFEKEHVLDLILVLSQDVEARENSHYNLLLMEIIQSLIRGQDPELLARSKTSKQPITYKSPTHQKYNQKPQLAQKQKAPQSSLLSQLRNEKRKRPPPTRHSHFGGTIMLQSASGKKVITSTTQAFSNDPTHNPGRKLKEKRKNVKHAAFIGCKTSNGLDEKMAFYNNIETNTAMTNFCTNFLKNAYGPLMKSLKNEFRRESSRLEASDRLRYFNIVRFFSVWYRNSYPNRKITWEDKSAIGPLVFTMDVFSFSIVLKSIVSYNEQKKYLEAAQAVALYNEMMQLLHCMSMSEDDETEKEMALGLMDRLYYASEPIEIVGKLLSWWKPGISTKEYAGDIVELVHVSLKLLDVFSTSTGTKKSGHEKKKNKSKGLDMISRIRSIAEEFEVSSYFGKLISNHTVYMYTTILSEYTSNTPRVNHHIIAFFTRMCKFVIFDASDNNNEKEDRSGVALKNVTLEPMLFNIQLLTVCNKILNDDSRVLQNRKDYPSLSKFAATILRHFAEASESNPMLFVECLFRFPRPHHLCEKLMNHYMSEELVMLLREKRHGSQGKPLKTEEADNKTGSLTEDEPEWTDKADPQSIATESTSQRKAKKNLVNEGKKSRKRSFLSDTDDEEGDSETEVENNKAKPASSTKHNRIRKKKFSMDDDSDDENPFGNVDEGNRETKVKKLRFDDDDDDEEESSIKMDLNIESEQIANTAELVLDGFGDSEHSENIAHTSELVADDTMIHNTEETEKVSHTSELVFDEVVNTNILDENKLDKTLNKIVTDEGSQRPSGATATETLSEEEDI